MGIGTFARECLARRVEPDGGDPAPRAPGVEGLRHETVDTPPLRSGDALVRVHAAAITRDELEWPLDRLPAIPSYELSGVIAALADDVDDVSVGDEVYALTPFDRDGVAAEYAVPAAALALKPSTLGHVESAAVPLPALSAWQGLFDHGRLEPGEPVPIFGGAGGRWSVRDSARALARGLRGRNGTVALRVDLVPLQEIFRRSRSATDEVNSGPGIALSLLACFAPANKGQRATCSTGPIEVPTKRH